MKYRNFESVISSARMSRYLAACNEDTKKAMTLYRKNLKLSQEIFTLISCFEVTLRNKIDEHYTSTLGTDWLREAANLGGIFANQNCRTTAQTIYDEALKLNSQFTHPKLVASLGFGFWRFMFSEHQYRAGGQSLLDVFPKKPQSSHTQHYNAKYVFKRLAEINELRNRIAHHEPVCFIKGQPIKNTTYARDLYSTIIQFFQWMDIDESALLYGLDHIIHVCDEIDNL